MVAAASGGFWFVVGQKLPDAVPFCPAFRYRTEEVPMANAVVTLLCGAVDPFDHGVPVTCTLPAGHGGDDHEDRVTDGCITVWSKHPAPSTGPDDCLYRDDPGYPGPQYCDCYTCAG